MAIQVVKIREFKGHSQAVYTICKAADGDSFYSAGGDGMLVKWQVDEEDGILMARHESAVFKIAILNNTVMTGSKTGVLSVFDAVSNQLLKHLQISNFPLFDILAWHDFILLAAGDGVLYVLDKKFNLVKSIRLSDKSLRKIILMDNGIALGSSDGKIRILDEDLQLIATIETHEMSVFSMAYQLSEKRLLSGGRDAVLQVHNSNVLEKKIAAHLLHIHDIQLSPAANIFATASMDKTVKLWHAETYDLLKVIDAERHAGHSSSVNAIQWLSDNSFISCSDDRRIIMWRLE